MAENSESQPAKKGPPFFEHLGPLEDKTTTDNVEILGPLEDKTTTDNVEILGPLIDNTINDKSGNPTPQNVTVGVRTRTPGNVETTILLHREYSVQAKPVSEAGYSTGDGAPPKQPAAETKSPNSIKPPNFSQATELIQRFTKNPPKKTRTTSNR